MWLWHVTCDVIQVLPSSVSTAPVGGCSRVTWVSQCKVTVWPVTTGSLTDNRSGGREGSGGSEGSEGRSNNILIDKLWISRESTWFAMVFVWHVVLVENVFHTLRGIENITLFNIRRSHYLLVIPSYMWGFQSVQGSASWCLDITYLSFTYQLMLKEEGKHSNHHNFTFCKIWNKNMRWVWPKASYETWNLFIGLKWSNIG